MAMGICNTPAALHCFQKEAFGGTGIANSSERLPRFTVWKNRCTDAGQHSGGIALTQVPDPPGGAFARLLAIYQQKNYTYRFAISGTVTIQQAIKPKMPVHGTRPAEAGSAFTSVWA